MWRSRARPSPRWRRPARSPTATRTRVIDAAGKIVMPGGIDPHVHMQHPFVIKPDGTTLYTQGPEQVGRAALYGGTTTLIDFAYVTRGPTACRRHRGARQGFRRQELAATGPTTSCCAASRRRSSRQLAEAIQAGYPDAQDLHHQHPAAPHRAHDRLRRHLGGVQGAGQGGRARRHPRRGQRHRHAHVRQADPRGPRRLREPGGGAQHAVGGPELPARACGWPRACRARRST